MKLFIQTFSAIIISFSFQLFCSGNDFNYSSDFSLFETEKIVSPVLPTEEAQSEWNFNIEKIDEKEMFNDEIISLNISILSPTKIIVIEKVSKPGNDLFGIISPPPKGL